MLEVQSLSKIHENGKGIKDMSFVAEKGKITAFIGPNGACKTTLFRVLAGVDNEYSGSCKLDGYDLSKPEIKKRISWLDEKPFVFPEMTPVQFAFYLREMKELNVSNCEINNLLNDFDIYQFKDQKIKTFSQGMYKKAAILPVFLGQPEFLILDEPTNGLDTHAIITLKQLILQAKERGSIIMLSSHILDFVGKVSDKVFFLNQGNICAEKANIGTDLEIIYQKLYS